MSKSHPKREPDPPSPGGGPTILWNHGDLFHVTSRYPRKPRTGRVDRLANILRHGLIAPACCEDGSVYSDLNLVVTGSDVPYDSLVFLHRFGEVSFIYTYLEPGRFAVFVDPAFPVMTPHEMGAHWVMLCMDEVYAPKRVPPEHLTRVVIHPADAESVLRECLADFQRLGISLFDWEGNALLPQNTV